jgi:hypothetical protein
LQGLTCEDLRYNSENPLSGHICEVVTSYLGNFKVQGLGIMGFRVKV